MDKYFAYVRVSTAKQGEKGVSLQEQRDAIARYAEKNRLSIVEWFEERVTAAKRGRPVFNGMLKRLRQKKAAGVVIHKIDRSARNLKDWADLGELIDQGITVHFANESLDLNTRGGRLSADIQAVVAADFIRNLKAEARKGMEGRLKQGLYPFPAPVGYLDQGKGKPKAVDPVKAPLVNQLFELYGTGRYNLENLGHEAARRGLRNTTGGRVSIDSLSIMLNNPFYVGLIHIKKTGESFEGVHQPLVRKALFDRVQSVLRGRVPTRAFQHDFLFRRLLLCARCGYSLIGERQKGNIYYRCHTKACPETGVREEAVDATIRDSLAAMRFTDDDKRDIEARVARLRSGWARDRHAQIGALELRRGQVSERLVRLTDAFLDGTLEKSLLEERKTALLMERKQVEDDLRSLGDPTRSVPKQVAEFLELAGAASNLYETGLPEEKRELLEIVTSNRQVEAKKLVVTLSPPFDVVARRVPTASGAPDRDRPRTLATLVEKLWAWFKENPMGLPLDSLCDSLCSSESRGPEEGRQVAA